MSRSVYTGASSEVVMVPGLAVEGAVAAVDAFESATVMVEA